MKKSLTAIALFFVAIAAIAFAVESQKRRNETPNERFYRKGGKETKTDVVMDHGALTSSDIAQKRDLTIYDDGGHINCRLGMVRYSGETANDFSRERCQLPKLRDFVWDHWQSKKRGYIRVSFDSVDAVSTSHLFIEPDSDGKWHVAWRIARHNDEITEFPTSVPFDSVPQRARIWNVVANRAIRFYRSSIGKVTKFKRSELAVAQPNNSLDRSGKSKDEG